MKAVRQYLLIFSVVFALVGCMRQDDVEPISCGAPKAASSTAKVSTSMEVTVRDLAGNIVPGAKVTLFKNQADWSNDLNAVATATTDYKGVARLSNLEPIMYHYDTETDCIGQIGATTPNSLTANAVNKFTTVLNKEYGSITIPNNSADTYELEVDGQAYASVRGRTSEKITLLTGEHTFKAIRKSGDIAHSTVSSCTKVIGKCGQYTWQFP